MTHGTALDGHLLPNETIVWSGRPPRGLRLEFGAFFLVFAILFCVGIVQNADAMRSPYRWPIVAAVLLLAVIRLLADPWQRARTCYALTDRRVLIVRSRPWPDVIALPLDRLPEITLVEEAHGRGTIRFGRKTGLLDLPPRMPRLVGIVDAGRVRDLIERTAALQR